MLVDHANWTTREECVLSSFSHRGSKSTGPRAQYLERAYDPTARQNEHVPRLHELHFVHEPAEQLQVLGVVRGGERNPLQDLKPCASKNIFKTKKHRTRQLIGMHPRMELL